MFDDGIRRSVVGSYESIAHVYYLLTKEWKDLQFSFTELDSGNMATALWFEEYRRVK